MVDWNSDEQIAKVGAALSKLIHGLAGAYLWEFIVSLDFDYAYLARRRKFRWPMMFYFLGRYIMLGYIIAQLIVSDITPRVLDCQRIMTWITLTSAICCGLASLNLAVRAVAVWQGARWVLALLAILGLAQWAWVFQATEITTFKHPDQGCVIILSNYTRTVVQTILTMVFDFAVMILVTYKLALAALGKDRPALISQLFRDGLLYFIVVFVLNCLATIVVSMNLSPVMDGIVLTPSSVISTIAASRVVRRLNNYLDDQERSWPALGPSVVFRLSACDVAGQQASVTHEADSETDPVHGKKGGSLAGPARDQHDDDHVFPLWKQPGNEMT